MEMTISFDGLLLQLALEEVAFQKNVFGYQSISESVASALGSSIEEIMEADSNHPDFMAFIRARNIIVRDVWGW